MKHSAPSISQMKINYKWHTAIFRALTDIESERCLFDERLTHADQYLNFIMIQTFETEEEQLTILRVLKKILKCIIMFLNCY